MEEYLKQTESLDYLTPIVQEKIPEILKSTNAIEEKAQKIFYFVRDHIKYQIPTPPLSFDEFISSNTLQRKQGFCIPKAILLTSLARAIKIPARLRFADIKNHLLPKRIENEIGTNIMIYHGYTELFLKENWVKVNPAFDADLCERHEFFPVDFFGSADALFAHHDRRGRIHFEYLKDHGYFSDFNNELYNEVISAFIEFYGS